MSGTWRFYEAPPIYRHDRTKKKNKGKKSEKRNCYLCDARYVNKVMMKANGKNMSKHSI